MSLSLILALLRLDFLAAACTPTVVVQTEGWCGHLLGESGSGDAQIRSKHPVLGCPTKSLSAPRFPDVHCKSN